MNVLPDASRITRRRKNLRKLTNARSIAFIGGASAASGIEYCRALGFQGDVWAVNPKHSVLLQVNDANSVHTGLVGVI